MKHSLTIKGARSSRCRGQLCQGCISTLEGCLSRSHWLGDISQVSPDCTAGNQGVIYTMPYLKFTNFMKKISKMIKLSFLVDFPTFNTEDMKCDLTVCTGHCGLCGVFMIYCVWGSGANCLKVHLMLSCFLASSENSSYNVSNKHRQHSRISIYFCFWNFN